MKVPRFIVLICSLCFMLFTFPAPIYAALISLSPTVDGQVVDVFGVLYPPPTVQQDLSFLEAYQSPPPHTGFETRSAMEFDISGIAQHSEVNSVSLMLTQSFDNHSNATGQFELYGYSGDGTISLADAMVSGNAIGSFSASTEALQGTIYDISLSSLFLQGLVDNGEAYFGLTLRNSELGGLLFDASEQFGSTGPSLSVDFSTNPVPIPSAIWLLGSGLIGLVGVRKKN